ncbi:hypothetical protein HLH26_04415 [Gluconacetobacter sp. 1b LMG 1731]|uniref:Uncharacterized protein n=1 Tax=Gluconacetobacter dulcium TaxID=2729096 RepID=A0A7W4IJ65_9PROT|nr:hypothetical protein [Gluconacetobacter dulcium]MBB2163792.1 hypothetical protein [Gluconacetobacter dulcium]MBB2193118.1 hypothetical protein [Gluconacetobacter dulcium]
MQGDDGRIALDLMDETAFARLSGDGKTLVLRMAGTDGGEGQWLDQLVLPASSPFAHGGGCVCCTPDGAIAAMLADLFRARVTGQRPWFARVIVVVPAALREGTRQALEANRVVAARYRPVWLSMTNTPAH